MQKYRLKESTSVVDKAWFIGGIVRFNVKVKVAVLRLLTDLIEQKSAIMHYHLFESSQNNSSVCVFGER